MIQGLMLALLAGALVSLQNIFNSKVNEHAGLWITTTIVLGMGALASCLAGLIMEGKNLFVLNNMQPWYWFSGVLGVGVVTCLTKGIKQLGPSLALSIALTSQLVAALLLDTWGWLGLEQVPFTSQQLLGVAVIVGGIFVFKYGDRIRLKHKPVDVLE